VLLPQQVFFLGIKAQTESSRAMTKAAVVSLALVEYDPLGPLGIRQQLAMVFFYFNIAGIGSHVALTRRYSAFKNIGVAALLDSVFFIQFNPGSLPERNHSWHHSLCSKQRPDNTT
jgi:hypothetical protein